MNPIFTYNQFLNESKQVGTVYHFCTLIGATKILNLNFLKASSTTYNFPKETYKTISTTRDKFFINRRKESELSILGTEVGLVLDGNKMSTKYKVTPFDDRWDRQDKRLTRLYIGDEYEEVWWGDNINRDGGIKNIKKYIVKILFTKYLMMRIEKDNLPGFFMDDSEESRFQNRGKIDWSKMYNWTKDTTPETRLKDLISFFETNFDVKVEIQ